jgi:hypothetical protein
VAGAQAAPLVINNRCEETKMKQHHKLLALLVTLVIAVIESVTAIGAARAGEDSSLPPASASCGGLRLEEFYACQLGGWQPDASPEESAIPAVGSVEDATSSPEKSCGRLRLDEFYACKAGNWRPDPSSDGG